MTNLVSLDRTDDVFVLTLTNGENRFNADSLAAIHGALDEVDASLGSAALVVTGQNKFFSNGLDLDWLMGSGAASGEAKTFMADLHRLFLRTLTAEYATAVALNGHVFAAGAMWSTAFDFRVMRIDRGYWCLPEVDLGLPLTEGMNAIVTTRLPPMTSHEVLVTGNRYGGEAALALGIVDAIAVEDEVLSVAVARAKSLASKRGPTQTTIKRMRHAPAVEILEAVSAHPNE